MDARRHGLSRILDIQARVNQSAGAAGLPQVSLIDAEEQARIMELIAANTWPQKWTGDEPVGDVLLDRCFTDGTVQPLLGITEG